MIDLKSLKLKKLAEKNDLDEALQELEELEGMERAYNELSRPIVSELDFYKKEMEISSIFNLVLVLNEIKQNRKHEKTID